MKTRTKKWWEKTVEYAYIKQDLGDYEFIWPFDGDHETLSDSAIANGLLWSIVEFKSTLKWESAEQSKFDKHGKGRYLKAKKALTKEYGSNLEKGIAHHFIVYGELNSLSNLVLKSECYFSTENRYVFVPTDLVKRGIELTPFTKYVFDFNKWKNGSNGGGLRSGPDLYPPQNPNGGLGLSEYGAVIGVGVMDNVAVCMSIEDFVRETTPTITAISNNRPGLHITTRPFKATTGKLKHPPEEDESYA